MLRILLISWLSMFAVAGDIIPKPVKPLPNVRLVDQDEKSFYMDSLKDGYTFISFFYANCPSEAACPMTVTLTKSLQKHVAKNPTKLPVNFLLVTLNPERDTPILMKKFASLKGVTDPRIRFVTGRTNDLNELKSALEVNAEARSDGDFYHDNASFLVDPKLIPIRKFLNNAWDASEVFQGL